MAESDLAMLQLYLQGSCYICKYRILGTNLSESSFVISWALLVFLWAVQCMAFGMLCLAGLGCPSGLEPTTSSLLFLLSPDNTSYCVRLLQNLIV